ncbi:helix-turn-helix transcriptional regulator [Paraburkholderia bannensis]|uniref:helix-turn-helix transcriptional regulator n=1 Tax=Paraburkholderia bannensis TaxID=765414 RepID=UPI002ABDBCBE|nr:helix-turn-helix transcriptional regulator [Paraburkholderia bannensis]
MDYPLKTVSQLRPMLLGFRKNAGLTQQELAQRLGISQQSYAAFEANPAAASVDRLFHVLRLLAVDLLLSAGATPAEPARRATASRKPAAKKVAVTKAAVKKAAAKKAVSRPVAAKKAKTKAPATKATKATKRPAAVKKPPQKASKPAAPRKAAARSTQREDW